MTPRKIIIAVAPVGKAVPAGIHNPTTAADVADAAISCWNAGASLVHLHVRDETGAQTEDLTCFTETVDRIRETSDMILQVSTGGLSTLTLEQRCVGLNEPRVESASLNMGSVNFDETVYVNTVPDIRYWAKRMRETEVVPEMEIFDLAMIGTARRLLDEGVLAPPLNFGFALGFTGALDADARYIPMLKSLLPDGAHWGVAHEGMDNLQLLAAGVSHGAAVIRCGFEDGVQWAPGKAARTNAELVGKLVELVRLLGRDVATPREARSLLAISP